MTAQCNSVGSTVLAIALNYLIQKIIYTVLRAQWDGEPGPCSQQHRRQQQPAKGTVPGKKSLALALPLRQKNPKPPSLHVRLF